MASGHAKFENFGPRERHNRRTKRKLKSHQGQKMRFAPFLGRGVRLQFSRCATIVPLRDATFLQMTRLLQVTNIVLLDVVFIIWFLLGRFFKKSLKTAVPDDGNPPGALVLTKLTEWHRFEVGREKVFFEIFVTCRSRVICKKVASRSGTIGAQSEN